MTKDKNTEADLPEFENEFSRMVDITTIPSKGRHYKYQCERSEEEALARRYGIEELKGLEAECEIVPAKKGEFKVTARFTARVIQLCCISLMPVEDKIFGEFSVFFKQPSRQNRPPEIEVDFEVEEEDFELLTSNEIDVGEVIAQHLSLEINPYPRHKDANGDELGHKIMQEEEVVLDEEKKNPFDALKSLKHKT